MKLKKFMKPRNSVPGIYYYKNKINGKLYIGQAQNLHKRHNDIKYKRYSGPVFNNAIKKYGLENFEYGILTHCKLEELNDFEIFYIKRLKSKIPNGYNMTDGGEGQRGAVWSEEKRELYRTRYLGNGNPNFGKKWNDEQRKRASEYMKTKLKGKTFCQHSQEITEKCYETLVKNKYGKTVDEIDEIIKKHINNGGTKNYSEIAIKYGLRDKTIKKCFERLGIENHKSKKLKEAYNHNPYIVQCDRLDHNKVLNIFPSLKVAIEKTNIKLFTIVLMGRKKMLGDIFGDLILMAKSHRKCIILNILNH